MEKTLEMINIDNELGTNIEKNIIEVAKWRGLGLDEVKSYYIINEKYELYYKEERNLEIKEKLLKKLAEEDKNLIIDFIENKFLKRKYYDNTDPFIEAGERVTINYNKEITQIYNNTTLTNEILDIIEEIDN